MSYKAFVSYHRASDEEVAATLQYELERFARPWYQPIRYRVFRDKTGAIVGGALDQILHAALRDSEYFILIASPESAAAPWVQEEVRRWCADERPLDRLLIVLTAGTIDWDERTNDFVWNESTAIPHVLSSRFPSVPAFVDSRWSRDPQLDENTRRGLWREAVATLSAKILAVPKEELIGEEIRQRRQMRRVGVATVAFLTLLSVLSLWLAFRSESRRRVAFSRQVALQALRAQRADEGLLLAVAALSIAETTEARGALLTRLQTNRKLLRVLHGHVSDVIRVALLDDATSASGDMQGVILLHRYHDGRVIGDLRGHKSQITALAAVRKAAMLVSADDSGNLLLWNVPRRTAIAPAGWSDGRLKGIGIRAVGLSTDEKIAAIGDDDGVLSIVDLSSRSLRQRFDVAEREISSITWINETAMVVGTIAGHVLIVNAKTGEVEKQWRTGAADIVLVGVDRYGRIFALDGAGKLTQWSDTSTSEVHLTPDIVSAAYDPVHDVIAAGDVLGAIHLFSRESGTSVVPPLLGHAFVVSDIAFSREGRFLLSGSFDESAIAWDLRQVHPIITGRYGAEGEIQPRVLADGSLALFIRHLGEMERWRLSSNGPIYAGVIPIEQGRFVRLSEEGTHAAWMTWSNEIWFGNGRNRKLAEPIDARVVQLCVSRRGAYVALFDDRNRVHVWRTKDNHYWGLKLKARDVRYDITSIAFSHNEGFLGVGTDRGNLLLFESDSGALVTAREGVHAGLVSTISIDERSSRIASGGGGGDRNIVLQEFPSLTNPRRLRGLHLGPIGALTVDHGAQLLASAGSDGTIVLWDVRTLQPIGMALSAHTSIPRDLRLSRGGETMLTTDGETVLIWDLRVASWKKLACMLANRELTRSEWSERMPDEEYRTVCGPS